MDTYDLHDVTVVADAGMISEANRRDLDTAGLSYGLGGTLKQSIDAHLTVVMAALAVGRWLESASGWALKKPVQTVRGYREMRINVSGHEAVAVVPLPPELVEVVSDIRHRAVGKPY